MLTSEYDFDLPDELIAQHPVEPRDASRLMVVDRRAGTIAHHRFAELPSLLSPGDILVRNDSRVIPARLIGRRAATKGRWEGLFLDDRVDGTWEVLARTRGRPALGESVEVGPDPGLALVLEGRGAGGSWIVRPRPGLSEDAGATTFDLLAKYGLTPLPPYIRRGLGTAEDMERYQTVYSRAPGSVAAPTAGLHFTDEVFARLAARGIPTADVTLHVGVGTFRPIEVESIEAHKMHAEWAEVTAETAETLAAARAGGGRIVAVGTTSTRTLETAAAMGGLQAFRGRTDMFIRPGHVFRAVDALVTNFHLPKSSLLVLVSALAGTELIRTAYAEAIRERYRFFSYGDAMLILG
ncbi:tRNA preQ1(34) S-adenosylmethionine ribosyltransferase-isomerase QueA [Paludisphaera rhizosphaerae]|uniref:tRNA preQ1(34) S-adenosylmethionine ribosyltransferase-isomerase QueA n=1 Tax=Paludisphaera rhizosphaerae TaxID=2711216 RepID=UPI0013EB3A5D|nr:tRNA preQ1(34) S-adenosylmethionine ribosyltransferase-isomerase QueA [Paludisphaera rhizosphaerae]